MSRATIDKCESFRWKDTFPVNNLYRMRDLADDLKNK